MTSEYIFSGSLPENASTYVTRQADTDLYDALNAGAFCYVLNSRQTGKSSLRVRTMRRLREEGIACAAIDLSFGGTQYVTMEQWYVDMLDTLVESLGLDVDLENWWEERELLSPLRRFRRFIEEILLVEIAGKIVIFIDEIDSILSLNFPTDDFFAFIRACYQERVNNPEFHRLTFCLLGVATPTNLIQDKKRTPFNIGRAIALKGFQPHEVQPLVKGLQGKVEHPERVLDAVLAWTGGQPFLTQKVCHLLASSDPPLRGNESEWVAELVQQHVIENWEAQDEPEHLRTIRDRILRDEERAGRLLGLYQEILQARLAEGQKGIASNKSTEQAELRLTGLVIKHKNRLIITNRIYENVFDFVWVETQLTELRPYAETFTAWLASECQDESRLLRGQALQDALRWASNKSLSDRDYQFLSASQELDKREIQAALEVEIKAKEVAEQANTILREAQQKAEIALEKEKQANQRFIETQRQTRQIIRASQSQRQTKPQRPTKKKIRVNQKKHSTGRGLSPIVVFLSIISLTCAIGYRFYNQPKLKEGTIAPRTIIAPKQAQFEDAQTTEAKRKEAQAGVVVVLQINDLTNTKIREKLTQFFDRVEQKRNEAGLFPFIDEETIPFPVQQFLRSATDKQWNGIVSTIPPSPLLSYTADPEIVLVEIAMIAFRNYYQTFSKSKIAQAARELGLFRQKFGEQSFLSLMNAIQQSRQNYAKTLTAIAETPVQDIEKVNIQPFLDLADNQWDETIKGIESSVTEILTQGIPPGLPNERKYRAIQVQLKSKVPEDILATTTDLLNDMLEPNLIEDIEETKRRATLAGQNVDPEMVKVEKGQVIVERGQKIERQQFVLLDNLELSRRAVNWTGLAVSAGLVTVTIGVFWLAQRHLNVRLRCRDRILLCLLSISTPLLVSFNVKYTNFPAVGLLVSSFYSPNLAVTHVAFLSGLTTFSTLTGEDGMIVGWEYLIPGVAGGLLAAAVAGRMRSREELALFGVVVGLTQGSMNLIVTLIISSTPGTIWSVALPGAALFCVSGIVWWVVALGLSPYLKSIFNIVTLNDVLDLSTPIPPLIERLMFESPDAFQQTMFVTALAESAAKVLGFNTDLVRAGAIYHNIGKLENLSDILENQISNIHQNDTINNPWTKAEERKKQIYRGLMTANDHNLPKLIQSFIPEYKGTRLMNELYQQAQQQSNEPISESDFRYEGNIPQSQETGIIMISHACAKVLQSMSHATPDKALLAVNKEIELLWSDGQLENSGLNKTKMKQVANQFIIEWEKTIASRVESS
ncbi:AAA-like domain-containing protein [Lusitaniella coriacea]|uniref:AAA-like domain-containing protein n=1 Tax=Lusitaniella coriacea TaxID=1983105 RepID=UPI003CF9D310